jgi:hypothetical protein
MFMHHGSSRQEIGCHFPEILGEVRVKLSRVIVVCMIRGRFAVVPLPLLLNAHNAAVSPRLHLRKTQRTRRGVLTESFHGTVKKKEIR